MEVIKMSVEIDKNELYDLYNILEQTKHADIG